MSIRAPTHIDKSRKAMTPKTSICLFFLINMRLRWLNGESGERKQINIQKYEYQC